MSKTHTETHTKRKTSSPHQHRPRTRSPDSEAQHPTANIQRARAAPESLSAADVLQLQRTIGNQAVGRLLADIGRISSTGQQTPVQRQEIPEEEELLQGKFADECVQCQSPEEEEELLQGIFEGKPEQETCSSCSTAPIQRMVSMNNWSRVYAPQTVAVDARYEVSLNTLMGNAHTIQQPTWSGLKGVIWPDGPLEGAPLQEVHNKFQHPRKVHIYANIYAAQVNAETEVKNLLLPTDMSEAADQLPPVLAPGSACVIQALVDFGIAAPGGAATDHAWHAWARTQNLDYRTDSDIIRIYVGRLGYSLVSNKTVTMAAVNWAGLGGDGNYLVSSYVGMPAGVGHMIGLVINAGAIQTIHDRQNLTAPTLNANPGGVTARYIYKM